VHESLIGKAIQQMLENNLRHCNCIAHPLSLMACLSRP
jgi:hypothetical protein